MKIAIAQINTSIGAFSKNRDKIINAYEKAKKIEADLVVFPELTITGYPPKDLLFNKSFIYESHYQLNKLISHISKPAAIIGYVRENNTNIGKPFFNSAAFIYNKTIKKIINKILIPSYDVFDEDRYFEPGKKTTFINYLNNKIGFSICEDIWSDKDYWRIYKYYRNPIEELTKKGIKILINMSASPYSFKKQEARYKILTEIASKYKIFIVYCNLVGASDELIFDGCSMVINPNGKLIAQCKAFQEDFVCIDTKLNNEIEFNIEKMNEIENLYNALALGIKEYMSKCGFKSAIIGLSGGIDSAVVACLAAEAIGPENVLGISLPTRYTSKSSIDDAQQLAKNLSIGFSIINIDDIFESYLNKFENILNNIRENITEQNIQARIRGNILMSISNKFNKLVLSTGNKSELAVGYCTLYGDMTGGLSVLADVPKTIVYKLANFINRNKEIIPTNIIKKPPSAELKPNQTDQDDLPPYDFLDKILKLYVEEEKSIEEINETLNNYNLVQDIIYRIEKNEYKRRQAPPGLKVSPRAFGIGRRIPITQQFTNYLKEKKNFNEKKTSKN